MDRFVPAMQMPKMPLMDVLKKSDVTSETTDVEAYFGLYLSTALLANPPTTDRDGCWYSTA